MTYFHVQGPWVQPPRATRDNTGSLVIITAGVAVVWVVIVPVGVFMARRNLRLGRGDLRGALRLSVFMFATASLASLFRADHTASAIVEQALLIQILSRGLYGAWVGWFTYMALEPPVRRRWPQLLISWNRLLEGRFRDPLLGRDVLIGALSAMAAVLADRLDLPSALLGREPGLSSGAFLLSTLSAPRQVAQFFFLSPFLGVAYSVIFLFLLYLIHAVAKRAWIATLSLFLVLASVDFRALDSVGVVGYQGWVTAAILIAVLSRVGLLATATFVFTGTLLVTTPLTLDWSAWYAGRSFAVLGFFAALLVAAFYTSLGGKPLFGKALLDD